MFERLRLALYVLKHGELPPAPPKPEPESQAWLSKQVRFTREPREHPAGKPPVRGGYESMFAPLDGPDYWSIATGKFK